MGFYVSYGVCQFSYSSKFVPVFSRLDWFLPFTLCENHEVVNLSSPWWCLLLA